MIRKATVVCLPTALGLVLSVMFRQGWFMNRVLVVEYGFDYIGLSWRLGVIGSLFTALGFVILGWHQTRIASKLEETAMRQKSEHQRFLQRLDHELKNPLTIMRLGITNLIDAANLAPDQQASAERIATQVRRVEQLVVDLRWLVELDERELERRKLSIQPLIQAAISASRVEYPERKVETTVQSIPWGVGDILGDADLLLIAFSNLLNNALKFTERDGEVQISITDNGKTCIIEIADSGMGIPSADQPFIFQELYRGSNARRISGGGMGLALVQRIISLHGGSVAVRSREGNGSVFTIQLPLANPGVNA